MVANHVDRGSYELPFRLGPHPLTVRYYDYDKVLIKLSFSLLVVVSAWAPGLSFSESYEQ